MERQFLFLIGVGVGLFIGTPVGPVGVLGISRLLTRSRSAGFVSGLGGATADFVFALAALYGLEFMERVLIHRQNLIRVAAASFLLVLGTRFLRTVPRSREEAPTGRGILECYGSTLLVALSNPMVILSMTAIFASLGLAGSADDHRSILRVAAGVFTGAALWWALLVLLSLFHHLTFTDRTQRLIYRTAGLLMILFAVVVLASLTVW